MYLEIAFLGSQYSKLMMLLGNAPKEMKGALREACKRAGGRLRALSTKELRHNTFVKTRSVGRAIGKLKIYQPDQWLVRAMFRVSDARIKAEHVKVLPSFRPTARKGYRMKDRPRTGFQVSSKLPVKYAGKGEMSKGNSLPFVYWSPRLHAMKVGQSAKVGSHNPIYPQYTGHTIASLLSDPSFFSGARQEAIEVFEKRLEHEIDYRIGLAR